MAIVALVALVASGCDDRAKAMADEADTLLFHRDYRAAARQFEIVLHECGDKQDEEILALRRRALARLAEIRHHYLDDPPGALAAYHQIADLSGGREEGFVARLKATRLLDRRMDDPTQAASELAALLLAYPRHARAPELQLELAQLYYRARNYEESRKAAQLATKTDDSERRIEATLLLATALTVQDKMAEAASVYKRLLETKLEPKLVARVRLELAHCHEALGNLHEALALYEAVDSEDAETLIESRIARVTAQIEKTKPPPPRGRFQNARSGRRDAPVPPDAAPPARTSSTSP